MAAHLLGISLNRIIAIMREETDDAVVYVRMSMNVRDVEKEIGFHFANSICTFRKKLELVIISSLDLIKIPGKKLCNPY